MIAETEKAIQVMKVMKKLKTMAGQFIIKDNGNKEECKAGGAGTQERMCFVKLILDQRLDPCVISERHTSK